jgi:hypothetical protein
MKMSSRASSRVARSALAVGLAGLLLSPTAQAFQFNSGDLTGSFDTTFSFGELSRLHTPKPEFYGTTNSLNGLAGLQNSVNTDNGNLNYDQGVISELFKGSHDLELKFHNFGFFARGYYFKDLKSDETRRTPLTDQAKDRVTSGAEILDLYGVVKFKLGEDMPVDIRFGRQVLSLGESTFLPNGVNVVNPVDLAKLRAPGAELKEAFLPVNMVKASIGLTKNITLEPFWLLEFRRNELEPAGTYFSTNDFASRGGSQVFLGFGTLPDNGTLGAIPRANDHEGNNFSQYGVAVRILAPALNSTEFGLYYASFHSRSPLISAVTPTSAISSAFVQATAASLAQTNLVPAMIANGYPLAGIPTAVNALLAVAFGIQPASILTPLGAAPFLPAAQSIAAGAGKIGLLTAAATGRYFIEYPEDIHMVGASFNTSLGNSGISWQGEVSVKNDVPLQVDDVELLFATLSALSPTFGANNQIGSYLGQLNKYLPGYRRHRVVTTQTTLTKVFGPTFGSQQLTLLGEVGGVWANLPDKSVLRYDGPGTFTSASAAAMTNTGFGTIPATPESAFADPFSWGYQVYGKLDYNNVFAGVNVSPSIAFAHDVKGVTPLPLGNYIKGRKSLTLAAEFTFQNAWSLEVRYVNFFGGGRYNLLGDRDYAATTLKYSF